MKDETRYRLLKLIEAEPNRGQRQFAQELGVSLGKVNYCLKALLSKGLVKVENFYSSSNKKSYIYKLTPAGIKEKASVSLRFLKFKMQEYEKIRQEIDELKNEIKVIDGISSWVFLTTKATFLRWLCNLNIPAEIIR